MGTEITRRVVTTKTGAAGAAGTITYTNQDGISTGALAGLIIEISGTNRSLTDITAIRIRSKVGEILNANIADIRAWIQRMTLGHRVPADAVPRPAGLAVAQSWSPGIVAQNHEGWRT